MEKALLEDFLLALFLVVEAHMLGRTIMGFLIKHAGIVILEPTQMAQDNWSASCVFTGNLVTALHSHVEFRSGDHAQLLTNYRLEILRWKGQESGEALSAAVGVI